jgi:thiol-disulfide isomerase/thioredoxin
MLRQLIIFVCLLSATCAIAQPNKIKEKEAASEIDYKLMGAPMPPMLLVTYHDTSVKKEGPAATIKHGGKKNRKNDEPGQIDWEQKYITDKDLNNGANLFVMLFNPTCSHCEDQTVLFEKNSELFKRSKIVLMANKGMRDYIPDFIKTLHTDDYPQIYVGTDSGEFIGQIFLYSTLPQINVYSGKRKLLRTFTGGAAIDSLKQYIQ